MKGFVPTPPHVVDGMVDKLFGERRPTRSNNLLDPGCGTGAFIEGILRWCRHHHSVLPSVVGIESDGKHLPAARHSFGGIGSITLLNEDFLAPRKERFDYIIGNPPYVPITQLSDKERRSYRVRFSSATGRFDLYLLFFEQALRLLAPGGRLVFITPEKFLYVRTAERLRRHLASVTVEEIHFLSETTFGELVTYPAVTTVTNDQSSIKTRIILRDGNQRRVHLPRDGSSWLPVINGTATRAVGYTLADVCLRISCGVATGADSIYIAKASQVTANLKRFAVPTIAGREISIERGLAATHSMLLPYTRTGELLREDQLGELGAYLAQPDRQRRLRERTCATRKPWYAFHENPPLVDILRPKILCKDITARPCFFVESTGEVVPRHSVYYLVPSDSSKIGDLCDHLNSDVVQTWLQGHCQRAANGFLRLQSHVLKHIPVPAGLVNTSELAWFADEAATV